MTHQISYAGAVLKCNSKRLDKQKKRISRSSHNAVPLPSISSRDDHCRLMCGVITLLVENLFLIGCRVSHWFLTHDTNRLLPVKLFFHCPNECADSVYICIQKGMKGWKKRMSFTTMKSIGALSSEHHRMATVKHKQKEVHCPFILRYMNYLIVPVAKS